MPIDPVPVKYVLIVNAIQARIENGTYPVGTKVPSEADLVREFGASRSTVVRALELLRQQGWLEGQQGIGRVVLGRPTVATRRVPRLLRTLFAAENPDAVTLLFVGTAPAPQAAAAALGVPAGAPVIARRRLVAAVRLGPVELSTVYVRPEHAGALAGTALVYENLLRAVARTVGAPSDQLAVRIAARLPEPDEAALLKIGRRDGVTTLLVSALNRTRPVLAVDAVVATSRRPVEVVFPAM